MPTYPLDAPLLPIPSQVVMSHTFSVGRSESPFSFQDQVFLWSGSRWVMQVALPKMTRKMAEDWIVFALQLQGQFGTFLYGDPAASVPRGSPSGVPVVNGTQNGGYTLATDGWTASRNGLLLKGDYIQVGTGAATRLLKCAADVNSDAGGNATIALATQLKGTVTDNTAIATSNCKGVFRMTGNDAASWNVDTALEWGYSFSAIEVIPSA